MIKNNEDINNLHDVIISRVKNMSNRELLEAIYVKLMNINSSTNSVNLNVPSILPGPPTCII